jgi:hypothetical protein
MLAMFVMQPKLNERTLFKIAISTKVIPLKGWVLWNPVNEGEIVRVVY